MNPTLDEGEPGLATDLNNMKIGDGVTPWNGLDYIIGSVFNAETQYDFPPVGSENFIYKASKERKLYQWNPETMEYEELCPAPEPPETDPENPEGTGGGTDNPENPGGTEDTGESGDPDSPGGENTDETGGTGAETNT